MLRWRLILGPLLIALLLALCWLDLRVPRPGIVLVPLAAVLAGLATQELLVLCRASGSNPLGGAVYAGVAVTVAVACAPIFSELRSLVPHHLGWLSGGLVGGLILVIVGEMIRFEAPGQSTKNLSAGVFVIFYVGGLLGFLIQLRLLPLMPDVNRGGMLAMMSMILIVKATDIGAYTAGHLFGRHKFAPVLSPGKTWEGCAGGVLFALIVAFLALGPMARMLGVEPLRSWPAWLLGTLAYGLLVSLSGMIGDLAVSLLKRDARVKESSNWLPGFGGVLDLMDSLLMAAPVAYACWLLGIVAP